MTEKRRDPGKYPGWPGYYHRMALGRPGSLLRELATMAIVCAMGLAGVLLLVWLVKVISRSGVHGIIAVP